MNSQVNLAEEQIQEIKKRVDYNTLEYPMEVLIDKYLNGEIFTPDGYQKENASRFVQLTPETDKEFRQHLF